MPQLTPGAARVIDPVLTQVAQGWANPEFVGSALFPVVPVDQRGGRVVSFGKEDFALYNSVRAPGAATRRVVYGYSSTPYALIDYSLEGTVPVEVGQEAAAVPGIDAASNAVTRTQNIMGLRLEVDQANLATTAANYDAAHKNTALAGATLWSDAAASDPIGNVEAAKDAIRATTGRRPNTIVIGAQVMKALKVHSKVIDRIKYTGRDVPTADLLASLFDVKRVLVGEAVYTDATGAMVDVWGKNVVLAYTELGSIADFGLPSFGYTYRLKGMMSVESPYYEHNIKSWCYPVTDSVQPVIAGATAGFLISPAVA